MTRPRPAGTALFTVLILLFGLALQPVTAPSAHAGPDTKAKLSAAQAQAEKLRSTLAELRAKEDWTNERLAYAQQQLAGATSQSISADQHEDNLADAAAEAAADLAHRVRAIDQSGGAAALYTEAWTGTSITDVTSNLAALNAVLGTFSTTADVAVDATTTAAATNDRLADRADSRAVLLRRVERLADDLDQLVTAKQRLLRESNQHIKSLAHELAVEREAAAAAQAASLPTGATNAGDNPYAGAAVAAAMSKLGADYVWGAEGPSTFDCSGLVLWSYAQAGLTLPRLASDQYFASTPVDVSDMQPGDLLVYAYNPKDQNTIHHITMYIGNGQMVHAPHTGDVVRVVPVYYDGLFGVGRPGL